MKVLAAFLVGFLFVMATACASRSCVDMDYYGGARWRVLDAERYDAIESMAALRELHKRVQKCTGKRKPFSPIRAYSASVIVTRHADGWHKVAGFTNSPRIYVVRGLDQDQTIGVLGHELVHYVTGFGHPAADSLIVACGFPLSMKLP